MSDWIHDLPVAWMALVIFGIGELAVTPEPPLQIIPAAPTAR